MSKKIVPGNRNSRSQSQVKVENVAKKYLINEDDTKTQPNSQRPRASQNQQRGGTTNQQSQQQSSQQAWQYSAELIPPSFKRAKQYAKYQKFGIDITREEVQGLNVDQLKINEKNAPHDVFCSKEQLLFFGLGYPLFFNSLKLASLLLIVVFSCTGIASIYTNYYRGQNCTLPLGSGDEEAVEYNKFCQRNWIFQLSTGNKLLDEDLISIQETLNVISVVLMILLSQHLRVYFKKSLELFERYKQPTISSFSVILHALPKEPGEELEQELEKVFTDLLEVNLEQNQDLIAQVSYVYDTKQIRDLRAQVANLVLLKKQSIQFLYVNGFFPEGKSVEDIDSQIQQKCEKIKEISNKLYLEEDLKYVQSRFLKSAIVTFTNRQYRDQLLERVKNTGFFFNKRPKTRVYVKNCEVRVEEAPDPQEVLFDNFALEGNYFSALLKYLTLLSLFLVVSFVLSYLLLLLQKNLNNDSGLGGEDLIGVNSKDKFGYHLLNLLFGILVTILCLFSNFVVLRLSKKLPKKTLYEQENIALRSMIISKFLISAIFPFFLEMFVATKYDEYTQKLFKNQGLVHNETYVLVCLGVLPFLGSIFDLSSLKKYLSRSRSLRDIQKGRPVLYTQAELNELFQHEKFEYTVSQSDSLNLLFLSLFYYHVLPLGLIFGILGIFLLYWVDKYNLINRRSVRSDIPLKLNKKVISWMDYGVLAFSVGMTVFEKFGVKEDGQVSSKSVVTLVLSIIYILIPRDRLSEYLKGCCQGENRFDPYEDQQPEQVFPAQEQEFENVEMLLNTDYQRENPATSYFARLDYLEKVREYYQKQSAEDSKKKSGEQRPSTQQSSEKSQQPHQQERRKKTKYENLNPLEDPEESKEQNQSEQKLQQGQEMVKLDNIQTEEPLMSPSSNQNAKVNLIGGKAKEKSKSVGKFLKVELKSQDSERNDQSGGGAESD